jgi:CHAD domain-containing protein
MGREECAVEVEAKFSIPERDTLLRLRRIVRLGPYTPEAGVTQEVLDRYYDTTERTLFHNGYACRFRYREGACVVALKGLGQAESAIHERYESEQVLPVGATADPTTWPEWEGRELVTSLLENEPLEEIVIVEQTRHVRPLRQGDRLVAELSVDQATIHAGGHHQDYGCLEAELVEEGTIGDLRVLASHLTETWGLSPEPRSKFELGLALLARSEVAQEYEVPMHALEHAQTAELNGASERLLNREREQLEYLAEHAPDERLQRQARLILGWGQGVPVKDLIDQVGFSSSWTYELIKRFREERLAVFPAQLVVSGESEPVPESEVLLPVEAAEHTGDVETSAMALPLVASGRMSVAEMCERFQVDMAHAHAVRDHALSLFDVTALIHELGPQRRRLLDVMAMLHNVGLETDPDRHHVAGRDIILENPLDELSEIEGRMLAAAVYLHRKRIKPRRLRAEVVASLPPGIRRDTLVLTALVRLADGLDYAQSQATVIEDVRVSSAAIRVLVSGLSAEVDAARAQAKSDLWELLFDDVPFFFATGELALLHQPVCLARQPVLEWVAPKLGLLTSPGILPDDPMSEAGRKVLYFHFLRMLKHEPGTLAGEDIEELHDMRVATRRMRSAFRVFAPYFKARGIRPYIVGLRRTARALGTVRDLDVFMQKAQAYLDDLSPEQAADLDPLFATWETQRVQARKAMIDTLDSAKYRDFVQAFQIFLETPGAGARCSDKIPPKPTLVRHVAPQLIYARWAGVQAFGPLLDDAPISVLHALRIECKRLRYTLEFFREVMGPESEQVIDEVVGLQDHLGDLNDADVANALLSDFLFAPQRDRAAERMIAPGVVAYLAVKQRELQSLVETFPQVWERFNRPQVRQFLAGAVAVL